MFCALSDALINAANNETDRSAAMIGARIAVWVVVLIAFVIGALLMQRVARAMKKVGASLGWAYRRKGTALATDSYNAFPMAGLPTGDVDHELSGVWRGHQGKVVVLHASPRGYSAKYQVAMLELPSAMPTIQFHPRSNLQRNFTAGGEVLTGVAEFDQRWRVLCADPRYVAAVATPRVMQRLLAHPNFEIPVTLDGPSIYSWSPIHRAARRDIRATLDLLADVVEALSLRASEYVPPAHPHQAAAGAPHAVAPLPSVPGPYGMPTMVVAPAPRKNFLAVLSVLLPLTLVLAPVGVVCGHLSLRANRRGEATNHRWAVIGLVFSYAVTVLIGVPMFLGLLLAMVSGGNG